MSGDVSSGGNVVVSTYLFGVPHTIDAGGTLTVVNGVTLEYWENEGVLNLSSGAQGFLNEIVSGGVETIYAGGTADADSVISGGAVYVESGGIASDVFVENGGQVYIEAGGSAYYLFDDSYVRGVDLEVLAGATVDKLQVYNAASALIAGEASNTFIGGDGSLVTVVAGGVATNTNISNGSLWISSGGIANGVTLGANASLIVANGGTVTSLVDESGAPVSLQILAPDVVLHTLNSGIVAPGQTVTVTGTVFDGQGVWSNDLASITWGDGSTSQIVATRGVNVDQFTVTHVYGSTGSGINTDTITASIGDQADVSNFPRTPGALQVEAGSASTTVRVGYIPPVVSDLATGVSTINEGGTVTLTGSISDLFPGATDTVSISWGDGTSSAAKLTETNGNGTFVAYHVYDEDAPGSVSNTDTIVATATSNVGAMGSASTVVTVANLAPLVTGLVFSKPTINEGGSVTLTGTVSDTDLQDSQTVAVAWGDNTISNLSVTDVNGVGTFTASHLYLNNPSGNAAGAFAVTATATSKSGQTGSANAAETVLNVAPVVASLILSQQTISEGNSISITGSFTDAGVLDTHTAQIAWGDGTTSMAVVSEQGGRGTFSASHTYNGNAESNVSNSDTLVATVTDFDGGAGTASEIVYVTPVAPVVSGLVLSNPTINEGGSVTLTGSVSDVNLQDKQTVSVEWGDGTMSAAIVTETNGSGTFSATHQYLGSPQGKAGGAFTIVATATSENGVTGSASTSQWVQHVAPTISDFVVGSATISEGSTLTVSGFINDPGAVDTHTATISWGDGTTSAGTVTETNGNGTFIATHVYAGDPPANATTSDAIKVVVSDEDGATATAVGNVTVAAVAPVLSNLALNHPTITEGGSVSFTGSVSDADTLDAQTVMIDWGDGTSGAATVVDVSGSGSFTATHVYVSNPAGELSGSYTIAAVATSKDSKTASDSTAIMVDHALPVLSALTISTPTITLGGSVSVSGSFTYGGIDDTHTAIITWGDGTRSAATVTEANGKGTFVASHLYVANSALTAVSTDTITATVTDEDGGAGTAEGALTIEPVLPSLSGLVVNHATIVEGGSVVLTGTVTDLNRLDSQTIAVDWGDGSTSAATVTETNGSGTFSATHIYLNNPAGRADGSFAIGVTATSLNGTTGKASASVIVDNLPPSITGMVLSEATIDEGGTIVVSGSFTDAGVLDTHTATITWGDGTKSPATVTESNGSGTFTASHLYNEDSPILVVNSETISAVVTDDDGGAATLNSTLDVLNVAPVVSELVLSAPTISEGGTVTLTGVVSDPNLHDLQSVFVNWGDGSSSVANVIDVSGGGTFSVTHTYLNNPAGEPVGAFAITATATSRAGMAGKATTSETVANLPPVIGLVLESSTSLVEGEKETVTYVFTDPGVDDTHTAVIVWGDGTQSTAKVTEFGGSGEFSATHDYDNDPPAMVTNSDTISATITDDDGDPDTVTRVVKVASAPPVVSNLVLNHPTVAEGGTVSLSGGVSDINQADTQTVLVIWGDGTRSAATVTETDGANTFEATHLYKNNPTGEADGSFAISVVATSLNGETASDSTSVQVDNVAPKVSALSESSASIVEGGTETVTGTFTDPGVLDTHTALIEWGDGTKSVATVTELNGSGSFSATHVYDNDSAANASNSDTITATVTDDDGGAGNVSATVAVANTPPVISNLVMSHPTIDEGGSVTLTGDVADANLADTQSVLVTWGDGSKSYAAVTEKNGSGTLSATHTYLNNPVGAPDGTFAITATATSRSGETGSAGIGVQVDNVVPTVERLTQSATTIIEGAKVSISAIFSDVGVDDTHTAVVDWGDGTRSVATVTEAGGNGLLTASHIYDNDPQITGTFTDAIVATVTDIDGASGTSSGSVTVTAAAPVVEDLFLNQATINEGGSVTLTGRISDLSLMATSQTVAVTWGDGTTTSATVTETDGNGTFSATHSYANNPAGEPDGAFSITATATATNGAVGSAGTSVTVKNVAPTVTTLSESSSAINIGKTETVSGSFSDPGLLDTHVATINWGDGTSSIASLTESNGSGTFTASHVFAGGSVSGLVGNAAVTATVTDDDGGAGTKSATVTLVDLSSVAPGLTLSAGGLQVPAGELTSATVGGGSVLLLSNTRAVSTSIGAGGAAVIALGGVTSASFVESGGYQITSAGSAFNASIGSGGTAVELAGGLATGNIVAAGGADFVSSGGVAISSTVAGSGEENVFAGGVASGVTVISGGEVMVHSGGMLAGYMVGSGTSGAVFISSAGTVSGGTLISGVALTVASGGIVVGGLTLQGRVSAVISASVSAGQTITFAGSGGDLELGNPGGFAAIIGGFRSGDVIDLIGLQISSESFTEAKNGASGTLVLNGTAGSSSLVFAGAYATSSFIVTSDGVGGSFLKTGQV